MLVFSRRFEHLGSRSCRCSIGIPLLHRAPVGPRRPELARRAIVDTSQWWPHLVTLEKGRKIRHSHFSSMKDQTVGNYLRTHRKRAGMSQRELGLLIGYEHEGQVSRHER